MFDTVRFSDASYAWAACRRVEHVKKATVMNSQNKPKQTRRGRPSLARASAIDRLIVDIARAQFLADGFDAVPMEQIAAKAGISKGTLYARHPSKEVLFSAVIEASIKDWSDEAAKQDDQLGDSIDQRLRHHARTIATFLQKPDVMALQRLLLSVRSRFPELAATMHERGYRYIVDLITADMVAAGERDGLPPRQPEAVSAMLVAALSGFQMQEEGLADSGKSLETFAERLVDVIVAGRNAW
ncbi:TetR/AcrR family transcriptional regulator [Novosphingobium sp. BL-8H]|uniref:TetR/AcrR family transcriptional regulator n=1 Tax=Novosphingobium sp. BL-8H TaxID=3127640 RepID=UPI003756A35B